MKKRYFSVDVEASGPTPGRYSMLSLGACVVGDTTKQFYREIKPLNSDYVLPAIKVAAAGLRCLGDGDRPPEFDPKSAEFNPAKVMERLRDIGESPGSVMPAFAEWVIANSAGLKPVEAAAPIKFDGMFTAWYFDNFFDGENPFGHSGEDINSMYRGAIGDENAHVIVLGLRGDGLPHNALEDAVLQAKEMEIVLGILQSKQAKPYQA